MIKEVFEILKRPNNPIYQEYLTLLNNDVIEFTSSGQFKVTNSEGTTFKVTLPVYIDVNSELAKPIPTLEKVKLEYIRALSRKQISKELTIHIQKLKKEIMKYSDQDMKKIGAIKEYQTYIHNFSTQHPRPIYIKTLPIIEVSSEKAKAKAKTKKVVKERNQKVKEHVIGNMLLKYPFNMFNFSTKKECTSREVSKPYYISKKDLVDQISGNNEMKKLFPKDYKTMKKEQLCDVIFSEKN